MAKNSASIELAELRAIFKTQTEAVRKHNLNAVKKNGEKFYTGSIHITPGVEALGLNMNSLELSKAFRRYLNCDWGGCKKDAYINEATIKSGYGDIMGSYAVNGTEIWICTNMNEDTRTTILLPTEW